VIGEPAATLGAAKLEVLQRNIASTGIYDGLKVSGRLMMQKTSTHNQPDARWLRAVGRPSVISRVHQWPHSVVGHSALTGPRFIDWRRSVFAIAGNEGNAV